ncbi:MAG: hypothetical protein K2I46_07335, partial [Clostridia bacterium]|nr:hypothetical protein [Clostridia bacterium]
MDNQELLMKKMDEQPVEKIVEREVASANANDELMLQLIDKVQQLAEQPKEKSLENDDVIKQIIKMQEVLAHNQEMIMKKMLELSTNQNALPQVVEKEVRVEVPVEVVKEVPVEKIVEKEVVKEVPVERVVERVVDKGLPAVMPVVAPPKPKKDIAPRLTLKEAYAKLSKQQQKFFDGLREYAMSKDEKCKEKMSTYFTTIGPSTVNPLIKLTIKKNITVALFKMEDEYMKDIRRNAINDGAKIKVKETEVLIDDTQAFNAAKEMIDLRVDQIERYADYLREQRAMKS